jgi:hypothetical protein
MTYPDAPSHTEFYPWSTPEDIIDPRTEKSIFSTRLSHSWFQDSLASRPIAQTMAYSKDMIRQPQPPTDGLEDIFADEEGDGIHLRYFQLQDHIKGELYKPIQQATIEDPLPTAVEEQLENGQQSDFHTGDGIHYRFYSGHVEVM